jgi:hypothetical protein
MLEQRNIMLAIAKNVPVSWFTGRTYAGAEVAPISMEVSLSWNAGYLKVQIARL